MHNTKNVIEIIDKSSGDLIKCSGSTAISVLKVGYGIFPIPLDNGLMKESSISVTKRSGVPCAG